MQQKSVKCLSCCLIDKEKIFSVFTDLLQQSCCSLGGRAVICWKVHGQDTEPHVVANVAIVL